MSAAAAAVVPEEKKVPAVPVVPPEQDTKRTSTEGKIQQRLLEIGELATESAESLEKITTLSHEINVNMSPQCDSLEKILKRLESDLQATLASALRLRETLKTSPSIPPDAT
ncbi:MAG: hypothetical protein Harvfovirus4_42 [Harvfovirus sp.]|uniref:Uncharacterized protein n=1 Tax=Harvfovirus sp. TaxID=2487768 RepID=A0A3G5A0G8_9VIRU|nr:MAG: hypothetical protein Harvfovirus4_42 [Harvfovirus sp.]